LSYRAKGRYRCRDAGLYRQFILPQDRHFDPKRFVLQNTVTALQINGIVGFLPSLPSGKRAVAYQGSLVIGVCFE